MSLSIDWGNLVTQGRAKAVGIPWSDEEQKALKNGMTPEEVRAGILSKSEKEKRQDIKKSLLYLKKDELMDLAVKENIEFDKDAVTRDSLITAIEAKRAREKEE